MLKAFINNVPCLLRRGTFYILQYAALVHNIEAQKERVRAQAAQREALLQRTFQRTGAL